MGEQPPSVSPVAPGARISGPAGTLVVVDVGRREHSGGYGPVDLTILHQDGDLEPGSIVSTPWGLAEVVGQAPPRPSPMKTPTGGMLPEDPQTRLAEIERHLADATQGSHRRDCGGRLFAVVDGEEVQIGEAYAEGDARLWRHAYTDIRWARLHRYPLVD
jgi:hypothetical protein